ncbi:MAG: hypothetical protein ACFFCM_16480 [Promethearchaeota archaeon]
MTEEKFIELMESNEDFDVSWEGCNVFSGLKIITKYLPKKGIEGAEHDIIYSVFISDLIDAGITEEDIVALRKLNWMIDETNTGLACYV